MPEGPLPPALNEQTYPIRRLQRPEHVHFVYRHANGIHNHIYHINRLHPGKWHPDFQNRVVNALLFYGGVIRVLGWTLKKNPEGEAFYAFADQVISELKHALEARRPMDVGILPVRQALPQFDHKRSEFTK